MGGGPPVIGCFVNEADLLQPSVGASPSSYPVCCQSAGKQLPEKEFFCFKRIPHRNEGIRLAAGGEANIDSDESPGMAVYTLVELQLDFCRGHLGA